MLSSFVDLISLLKFFDEVSVLLLNLASVYDQYSYDRLSQSPHVPDLGSLQIDYLSAR